jgi:hypothetical protein
VGVIFFSATGLSAVASKSYNHGKQCAEPGPAKNPVTFFSPGSQRGSMKARRLNLLDISVRKVIALRG